MTGGPPSAADDRGPEKRSRAERRYRVASGLSIAVVSTSAMEYGLVVEGLRDSEEIVVKPLGRHLRDCKGYAGATIMGDGRVALILDTGGIARIAGLSLVGDACEAFGAAETDEEAVSAEEERQSLLLFRSAEDERFAVPLGQVARIEQIRAADVENIGGKRVI